MKEAFIDTAKIWDLFHDTWETMPARSVGKQLQLFHEEEEKHILPLFRGKTGLRVLDLGCGYGKTLSKFSKRGLGLHGVDVSPKMINAAKKNVPDGVFLVHDLKIQLPYEDGSFDFIFCTGNTLGNIQNPPSIIKETYRLLDKKGIAIFGVYNAAHLTFDFVSSYYAKLNQFYGPHFPFNIEEFSKKENTVRYSEGLFSHWFDKEEIRNMMQEVNFKVRIDEKGLGFIVVCQK